MNLTSISDISYNQKVYIVTFDRDEFYDYMNDFEPFVFVSRILAEKYICKKVLARLEEHIKSHSPRTCDYENSLNEIYPKYITTMSIYREYAEDYSIICKIYKRFAYGNEIPWSLLEKSVIKNGI
jgi:hypothetical protein